jgi:hypothetical protein
LAIKGFFWNWQTSSSGRHLILNDEAQRCKRRRLTPTNTEKREARIGSRRAGFLKMST